MEDKTLICQDCGCEFTFTVGEQEFYKEKFQKKASIMSRKDAKFAETRKKLKKEILDKLNQKTASSETVFFDVHFTPQR